MTEPQASAVSGFNRRKYCAPDFTGEIVCEHQFHNADPTLWRAVDESVVLLVDRNLSARLVNALFWRIVSQSFYGGQPDRPRLL